MIGEFHTHCSECEITARWLLTKQDEQGASWQALDGGFPCVHWRDHQDATAEAAASTSGRGQVGMVSARRAA